MVDRSTLTPLLDADTFVYACGFAADSQKRSQLELEFPHATEGEIEDRLNAADYERWALANVKTVINDIQDIFDPNTKVFLTGQGNFREQLATIQEYKGNRDPNHKPKYFKEIKKYLIDVWHAEVIHGREADDAIGCAQYQATPNTTVIVSIDKDMDNIPGYHYNWRKKEFYYIEPERADYLFWTQVLTGDKTDHIRGIPGTGPVTAKKILEVTDMTWQGMAEAVLAAYERAGLGWSEFYENASLLWIQREEDVNWDDEAYTFTEIPWENE